MFSSLRLLDMKVSHPEWNAAEWMQCNMNGMCELCPFPLQGKRPGCRRKCETENGQSGIAAKSSLIPILSFHAHLKTYFQVSRIVGFRPYIIPILDDSGLALSRELLLEDVCERQWHHKIRGSWNPYHCLYLKCPFSLWSAVLFVTMTTQCWPCHALRIQELVLLQAHLICSDYNCESLGKVVLDEDVMFIKRFEVWCLCCAFEIQCTCIIDKWIRSQKVSFVRPRHTWISAIFFCLFLTGPGGKN